MTSPFLDLLASKRIILFDGGMGTEIYGRGVFINTCYDHLNLTRPDLIRQIHQDFVAAGADIIETNTFGANRYKLKHHSLAELTREINTSGARIAREAAGDDVLVAGAMGPLGVRIEPWGPTSLDEAKEAFMEQACALQLGGVDLFVLETFSDVNEIWQAIKAIKECTGLPVVAQMTITDDGNSLYGTTPEMFAERLESWGADVVGINCSVGPAAMLDAAVRIQEAVAVPVSVQPNAGIPRDVEGRNIYLCSPEYLAEYAKRYIQHGVQLVGGCCGTSPEHTRSMRRAINALAPMMGQEISHQPLARFVDDRGTDDPVDEVPVVERSRFARKMSAGEFVVTVELTPPKGHDHRRLVKKAKKLARAGIDAINVPDGPRASSRMSALASALLIQQEGGIEAVLHYTCRDRNLLGIQSDLLGAYAVGIRNLLLVTGDPPKLGDYPDATAVFDVDSIGLTHIVTHLNQGLDIGGKAIGPPTGYWIGVGANPGAINLDYELKRFAYKVEAGAQYAITQPVFDVALLEQFLARTADCHVPIIAGIWPLTSYRSAEFMNNEVPGAHVPEPIMERMRGAKDAEEARMIGLLIAKEILDEVRPMVAGVQVSAPAGRVNLVLDVLGVGSGESAT